MCRSTRIMLNIINKLNTIPDDINYRTHIPGPTRNHYTIHAYCPYSFACTCS